MTSSNSSSSAGAAFVAFLRMEADLAEERAKQLRTQAQEVAHRFGIKTDDMLDLMEHRQDENNNEDTMAPLDENGVPKYKGKKRGRKPKKRLRRVSKDPNRPKRQHTAYTFFVQENYPLCKNLNPAVPSKDLITIVAKQWSHLSDLERDEWRSRAKSTHVMIVDDNDNETNTPSVLPDDDPDDDNDDDDHYDEDHHLEEPDQDHDGVPRQKVPGMESSTVKQQGLTTSSPAASSRRAIKRPKVPASKKIADV